MLDDFHMEQNVMGTQPLHYSIYQMESTRQEEYAPLKQLFVTLQKCTLYF